MGRPFFSLLILFLALATPALALTRSHDIKVTATVLPSPEWVSLLRSGSRLSSVRIPLLGYTIYRLHLAAGNSVISDQAVTVSVTRNRTLYSYTSLTDTSGQAEFILPETDHPSFSYTAVGRTIFLFD